MLEIVLVAGYRGYQTIPCVSSTSKQNENVFPSRTIFRDYVIWGVSDTAKSGKLLDGNEIEAHGSMRPLLGAAKPP